MVVVRAAIVAGVWLGLVPYVTTWTWRMYFAIGESTAWWIAKPPQSGGALFGVNATLSWLETFYAAINTSDSLATPPTLSLSYLFLSPFSSTSLGGAQPIPRSEADWFTKLSADIFTGQIIACLIVLCFIAVFLLREWIAQNAPPGMFEDIDEPEEEPVFPNADIPQQPQQQQQQQQQPDPVLRPPPINPIHPDIPLAGRPVPLNALFQHNRPRAVDPNLQALQDACNDERRINFVEAQGGQLVRLNYQPVIPLPVPIALGPDGNPIPAPAPAFVAGGEPLDVPKDGWGAGHLVSHAHARKGKRQHGRAVVVHDKLRKYTPLGVADRDRNRGFVGYAWDPNTGDEGSLSRADRRKDLERRKRRRKGTSTTIAEDGEQWTPMDDDDDEDGDWEFTEIVTGNDSAGVFITDPDEDEIIVEDESDEPRPSSSSAGAPILSASSLARLTPTPGEGEELRLFGQQRRSKVLRVVKKLPTRAAAAIAAPGGSGNGESEGPEGGEAKGNFFFAFSRYELVN
jgi:hypothetical protein